MATSTYNPIRSLVLAFFALGLTACAGQTYKKVFDNAHQNTQCPDPPVIQLYSTNGSSQWSLTPCEQIIVKAAIDYCGNLVSKTDRADGVFNRINTGGASLVVLSAAAAGIAGLITTNPPLVIGSAATLITSLSTDIGKVISGTPPQAPVAQMITAAQNYAQMNANLVPPQDVTNNAFYIGLWNAVGTSCPPSMLSGGFQAAPYTAPKKPPRSLYWYPQTATGTYSLLPGDILVNPAVKIAQGLEVSLSNNPVFSNAMTITNLGNGNLQFRPKNNVTGLTIKFSATAASSASPPQPAAGAAVPPAAVPPAPNAGGGGQAPEQANSYISEDKDLVVSTILAVYTTGNVAQGDTVTITATWSVSM